MIDPNADPEAIDEALNIVANWKSSHAFPLNTIQNGLRKRALSIDSTATVVGRSKRLSSIEEKLRRFGRLKLSVIQDIGGCRAVVSSVSQVQRIVELCKRSEQKHKLIDEDDYINKPKTSGYRSHHLIYRYHSNRSEKYNGLKIEIQVRSQMQHAWATAVETVGSFTKQALKSSFGNKEWLRFFALISSHFAVREGTPLVPGAPTDSSELRNELRYHAEHLGAISKLEACAGAVDIASKTSHGFNKYVLLMRDSRADAMHVRSYEPGEFAKAFRRYSRIERMIRLKPHLDAVLVSAGDARDLRRAYPNYYHDIQEFIGAVKEAIS